MVAPIPYQTFDGHDGLCLSEGYLQAYQSGQLLGQTATDHDDLQVLLGQYHVPQLLPELSFVHLPEQSLQMSISVDFAEPGEVLGAMRINGARQLWRARRTRSVAFMTQLPDGARSWVREAEPDTGWELWLPLAVMRDPDPVITRRVALAAEEFLYRLQNNAQLELPYEQTLTNVFQADDIWLDNLPRVVPLVERYLRDEN